MRSFFLATLFAGMQISFFLTARNVVLPNVFIGTGGHGHTHPAAQRPFGMVQLGLDTRLDGWDGCSGYHYSDSLLFGFSHTHLSGTGVSDYGDVLFRPQTGPLRADFPPMPFRHNAETAVPGYYAVDLPTEKIKVECTSSERVGRHRYSIPPGSAFRIWIPMQHRDHAFDYALRATSSTSAKGHRHSKAWATKQRLFFTIHASVPFVLSEGQPGVYVLEFEPSDGRVEVDVALSGVDEEGAEKNWSAEVENRSFDQTLLEAKKAWLTELSKVKMEGQPNDQIILSTALYHAFSVPNLWSDVDGRFRGMDDQIHQDTSLERYTVFSLWDTYRTAHPLYALLQPERMEGFLATILDHFDHSGRLPVWELAANETNCMIGYHAVSVLADAYAKGYRGFDLQRAIKAATATAEAPVFGLPAYQKQGYLTIQNASESVSKTLEYAYDDWCIAQLALAAGDPFTAHRYLLRSTAYRHVTDRETGWARPRDNGGWLDPFEPREVNNHYTEANAWQYSFSPVHDLRGWMRILGKGDVANGQARLEAQLDALFGATSQTIGREQADITGLIGQYAHGNEPSHAIAYLYNATANPWKGQEKVHQILTTLYSNEPNGLSGNEDCGQMSAWYVMASLGLYPLVPGESRYAIGGMLWEKAEVQLPTGKTLRMQKMGEGPSVENVYFNGRSIQQAYVDHAELMEGGDWTVHQTKGPTSWAKNSPYINGVEIPATAAPIIKVPRTFKGGAVAHIISQSPNDSLFLRINEGKATFIPTEYTLELQKSTRLWAAHRLPDGSFGASAEATSTHIPHHYTVHYSSEPNRQYTGGSSDALVDGIQGDEEWRKGHWVGLQGKDLILTIDLGKKRKFSGVSLGLLKDIGSWIALPGEVSFFYGKGQTELSSEWASMGTVDLWEESLTPSPSERREISVSIGKQRARFLRIKIINAGVLPAYHPGAGGQTFFFLDELQLIP